MSDETPWGHLERSFAQKQCFEDALPGLQFSGLSGEDVGVLLSDPSSAVVEWMRRGSGEEAVMLSAVEPPADGALPLRRTGKRGLLGWLSGANAIEGLGLFTESDVFELNGVQFAVVPEPLRPVVYGELVPMRVLALNLTPVPLTLTVRIEAERGVVQSLRRYLLSLEPGLISMALLPLRICPSSPAVVPVLPTFDVQEVTSERRWKFSARPYERPAELVSMIAGATVVAAFAGLSPVYLRTRGPADRGSPDPLRLRPDLAKPLVASRQAAALWRLQQLT